MSTHLRPLSTVEILDASWVLLRRQWLLFFAASGIGTAPLALGVLLYFRWLGTILQSTDDSVFYGGIVVWSLAMTAGWAVNCVARGAVTVLAVADARGETMPFGTALRRAGRQSLGLLFAGLAVFAASWAAGFLVVVPGLILAMTWWVARPVALQEDRLFAGILRRSAELTRGYRLKAFGLWVLLLLMWGFIALDLHLIAGFLVSAAADLLGIDTSGFAGALRLGNRPYLAVLLSLSFVLVDPLKCAADAVLYLDLRIRREGADLHERLRGLRRGAPVLGLLLLLCAPAHAVGVKEYASRIRSLRAQVQAANSPEEVDPAATAGLRDQTVEMPGGQKLDVRNDWLSGEGGRWKSPAERQALVNRLDALERSVAGTRPAPDPTAAEPDPATAAPETDVKRRLGQVLSDPDLQPLAERDELKELAKNVHLPKTKRWWDSFWEWVKNTLFSPPRPRTPEPPQWHWKGGQTLVWITLGALVLFLVALLVKWIVERPLREEGAAELAVAPAPLEASATENALDHSVDEWERFAQQWLQRGEVRQAVRALYLATLVHLHRERKIDYNRALTNWIYVRQFRGDREQQTILRELTRSFDEVWYGDRLCAEEQYRRFEEGVRSLGTPAPISS